MNRSEQLVIESKRDMVKRGIASPDWGDALALTFAAHVAPVRLAEYRNLWSGSSTGWMA